MDRIPLPASCECGRSIQGWTDMPANKSLKAGTIGITVFGRSLSARKHYTVGTHRTRRLAETLRMAQGLMPRLGITRLANQTGLDTLGIPVFSAIRPNSRSLATSQGKGLEEDAARVSALMENIEAWHAENVIAPLRFASAQQLGAVENVIPLNEVARTRDLDLAEGRAWIEGFDIAQSRACWVPFSLLNLDFVHDPRRERDVIPSTNGLASGNHLLEAILHGLYEVIERDATSLWEFAADLRPLDLSSVEDPVCIELIRRIVAAGAKTVAYDVTTDVGVPCFAAAILESPERRAFRPLGIYYGSGAHLDPGIALSRAITEAAQSRVTMISGSRDDCFRSRYRQVTNHSFADEVWAEVSSVPPAVRFQDHKNRTTDSFEDDLRVVIELLKAVGHDSVVVVDLSHRDVGIPVAFTVVPGLESPPEFGSRPGPRADALRSRNGG